MILNHTLPTAITDCAVTLNQDMKALIPELAGTGEYLAIAAKYLSSSILFEVKEATHGTRRLETALLKNWAAPFPPVAEQHEIVRRVEGLLALADRIEARLAKAQKQVDALTPSLLARAFRGELVPQDPATNPPACSWNASNPPGKCTADCWLPLRLSSHGCKISGRRPSAAELEILNRVMGRTDWAERLYAPSPQLPLFGERAVERPVISAEEVAHLYAESLSRLFRYTSELWRIPQRSSGRSQRGTPLQAATRSAQDARSAMLSGSLKGFEASRDIRTSKGSILFSTLIGLNNR
jgi:hypothetical protein